MNARSAFAGVGLVSVLALASGCQETVARAPQGLAQLVYVFESEGKVQAFDSHQFSREQERPLVAEGLTKLAARELACPASGISLQEGAGVACTRHWVATGCGKRTSYLVIDDEGQADRVPGHPGAVLAETTAIVPMSPHRNAAVGEFWAFIRDIGLQGQCAGEPDRYFELQAWGARDLDCPREQVLPLRFSRGAMAEGCGKRATYWGNRLSAIVAIPAEPR
jgi:hypothetical protein